MQETAVSWVRSVLRRTKPAVLPWLETPEQWSNRMMGAVDAVNLSKDVDALCMQFPDRIEECLAEGGKRLSY